MKSCIKTRIGHSESNNIFILEYSILDNNIQCKFDIDVSNYGNEVVGIKGKSDKEIHMTNRDDVIDEQLQFVCDCSSISKLGELIQSDTVKSPDEKLEYIKTYIDNFCNNWNLIHDIN